MTKIPFSISYRPQIVSGEYKVVTREDRAVEIIKWDLKGEFPVVGIYYDEKNERETVVQVTRKGLCSISPCDEYSDDFFVLIEEQSLLPEFVEDVLDIINRLSITGLTDEARRKVGQRILDKARKQFEKDMPKWRKSQNFEHHKAIQQIVIRDGKMFASSTKEIGDWFLDLSELEKLPKED